jgi:hypothetical protein
MNCVYKTPCGWCSKWDKECDEKMYTSSYRMKHPKPIVVRDEAFANKMCVEESDHEWECCGISTVGTDYICKKCGTHKTYPHDYNDKISVTI